MKSYDIIREEKYVKIKLGNRGCQILGLKKIGK
jgi:hypothetical protein